MRILALDTSTNVATAAILEDDVIIGEYSCNKGKTHSQRLMPMVQSLFESVGLNAADMDAFAASIGPGSFTGLRIGVTTVKAMAFAAQKPVVSVYTLDALAYNLAGSKAIICPVIDARNNQVYTAAYKFSGQKLEKLTDYLGIHINELADILDAMEGDIVFLGDAAKMHKTFFEERLGSRVAVAPANTALARAASVAVLAGEILKEGIQENCYDMKPFYLRKSQAEQALKGKIHD